MVLLGISSLAAILSFLLPANVAVRITTLIALVEPIPIIAIAARRAIKGQKSARIYTAAWVAFILGTVALAASRLGAISSNPVTEYGQMIGSALEVVLLSLALAGRLNELKAQLQVVNGKLKVHIENVEQIVEQKTMKIRSILKNIRQGIFSLLAKI